MFVNYVALKHVSRIVSFDCVDYVAYSYLQYLEQK